MAIVLSGHRTLQGNYPHFDTQNTFDNTTCHISHPNPIVSLHWEFF